MTVPEAIEVNEPYHCPTAVVPGAALSRPFQCSSALTGVPSCPCDHRWHSWSACWRARPWLATATPDLVRFAEGARNVSALQHGHDRPDIRGALNEAAV